MSGTLTGDGRVLELRDAILRGAELRFTAADRAYRGTIDGAEIVGDGWRARRLA